MATIQRNLFLAVLLCAPALAGCVTDPVTGESHFGMPISDAEERQLGENYQPTILHQFGGPYPDAALQSHLAGIVLGIARTSARPELDWEFTLVNSSVPNAFAVPGGKVFMTRGLLWRMEDEAEFVMVMGHEIGHVEKLHASRSMGTSAILQVLAGAGAAVAQSDAVGDLLGMGGGLLSLRYSRDHEREADVRGVDHAYAHGYDPREGADVFREFQKIKEESGGGGGGVLEAWTSSHPLDAERIRNIEALSVAKDPRLATREPVPGLRVTTPQWSPLITRLRREHKVYERHDEALAEAVQAAKNSDAGVLRRLLPTFEGCARELPRHAAFEDTLGRVYLALEDRAAARRHFERAADMNQGIVEPEYYLAALALEERRHPDAVRRANRALKLLPDNYPSLYVRGEALWAQGQKQAAAADFRKVLDSAPPESDEAKGAAARIGAGGTTSSSNSAAPARSARRRR